MGQTIEQFANSTFIQEERDLAAKMFTDQNRKNGALYPGGFGFLSPAVRLEWYSRARTEILCRNDI